MRYDHPECYDCRTKIAAPSFCTSCKFGGKPSGTSWKVTDQQIKEHRSKSYEEKRKKQFQEQQKQLADRLKRRERELTERLLHRSNQQTDSLDRKLEDLKKKLEGASERAYGSHKSYRNIPADYPPSGDKSRDYARKYGRLYDDRPSYDKPSFFDTMKDMWVSAGKGWQQIKQEDLKPLFNNIVKSIRGVWKAIDNWLRT